VSFSLSGPAPSGGATINFSTDNTAFPVPSTFTIQAGQSSGSMTLGSSTVITPTTTTTVTVTYNNGSQQASVTVTVTQHSLPIVTTTMEDSLASSSANLNGNVNPNGSATTAWFEYGTNSGLSNSMSTQQVSRGSGTNAVHFNVPISGLSANSTLK
jgi:hypothetical protein